MHRPAHRHRPRLTFAPTWCSARAKAPATSHDLDTDIRRAVLRVCGQRAASIEETTAAPGQTNLHFRVTLSDGTDKLVKAARAQTKPGLARARFQGEIAGLRALRTYAPAGGLTVPEGLGLGGERSPIAVLEWVGLAPFGLWVPGAQAELGKAVATLHTNSERAAADATGSAKGFGFGTPTYLGECALQNAWNPDWVSFFVHSRLVPRLDEALLRGASFYGTSNEIAGTLTAVAERIIDVGRLRWALFSDIEPVPALVHGDIFSGNCGVAKSSRECVLFDPAAYFGHSEVDLAVSTLFGRFSPEFYDAYHEVRPKEKGFEERRVLYRFYYLLNLLVRHGAGYGPGGSTQDPRGYFEMCCEHGKELMEILK